MPYAVDRFRLRKAIKLIWNVLDIWILETALLHISNTVETAIVDAS